MGEELQDARRAVRELAHVARCLMEDIEAPGSVKIALANKIDFYAAEGVELAHEHART
jgi:hypothetical protein